MNRFELLEYTHKNIIKNGKINAAAAQWGHISKVLENLKMFVYIKTYSESELLYRFVYDDNSIHLCECGNPDLFDKFTTGFRQFCSTSCSRKSKSTREKYEKTMTEKYGSAYPLQSVSIRKQISETNLDRYGDSIPQRTDIVKETTKKTNLSRYGVEVVNAYGSEDFKHSMIRKYGIENAMYNREFLEKSSTNSSSSMALKEYNSAFGKINYQTKLELDFVRFCEDNNIMIKNGPAIEYILNDRKHFYYVDFETENALIEIKGEHMWFRKDVASGKIDAKNDCACNWCNQHNKKFLFLLNCKNYNEIKEDL